MFECLTDEGLILIPGIGERVGEVGLGTGGGDLTVPMRNNAIAQNLYSQCKLFAQ